jgi:hypothetical protein
VRVRRSLLTEALALSLAIVATFAFSLLVVLEWELLGVTQSAAPYYFGFTFLIWGLTLLLIGYWYQSRRRSHDQRVTEELRFAYARGDLTTEEYQERRERLRERDEE